MRKILTASKDATIYEAFPAINTGLDEILEIGNHIPGGQTQTAIFASSSARAVIYFDLPTTASVFSGSNYFLNLKLANASKIKRNQNIIIYKVGENWTEGSGYFNQSPTNAFDGATWNLLGFDGATPVSWSRAGGTFLTSSVSQSTALTEYPLGDLRIDVTNILRPIVSQSLQNTFYGLGLQFPLVDEQDESNEGSLKIFSTQTHTIYQPTLEIVWDTQTFITGSLTAIPSLNVKISPNNIRQTYTKGDVDKVTLTVREQYPLKSFDSVLRYKNRYYLPTSSYYSIVDTQNNTAVIPFDDYSKINTDPTGSYIVLDTSPLYKGRFYTIKLKVVNGDYSRTIDTDVEFRVL